MKGVSKSFLSRANEAAFWEAWVGAVLARAGLYTVHHPFTADGSDKHGLSWDLDVAYIIDTVIRVEVKSLSTTFNNIDSYPFEDVLVCSRNSFRRKWPEAEETKRDFLLVSRKTGSIVWIPIGSPVSEITVTDGQRGETYKAMKTKRDNLKPLYDFTEMVKANV